MGAHASHHDAVHRVTRIWRVPHRDNSLISVKTLTEQAQHSFRLGLNKLDSSWVVLRKEDLGECRIYIDGSNIMSFRALGEDVRSGIFTLPDGSKAEIFLLKNTSWIDHSWQYRYRLTVNGLDHAELNDLHSLTSRDPPFVEASVVANDIRKSPQGEAYVVYSILVKKKSPSTAEVTITRRYRDFCTLDLCIRWSWHHHTHFSLDTLPKLPSRRSKTPEDHLNADFISARQQGLEIYLKQVLKLPRAEENPDVLAFFGLVPTLDDISFSSPQDLEVAAARVETHVPSTTAGASELSIAKNKNTPETLDEFERMMLASISDSEADRICNGPSSSSQESLCKLVAKASVEVVLKGIFKVNDVKPLLLGFNRTRRDMQVFNEQEFHQWCEMQLPSISDVFKNRVQQICLRLTSATKRPFPPRLDAKSLVMDDSALRSLTVAFTECYSQPLWNRLFASFSDGLSFQTLCTAVEGYDGPTLLVIQDSFGCRFGALAMGKWREETSFFSSLSGALFSLAPVFYAYRRMPVTARPKSKNVQYMNSRSRTLPLGMGFGGELHSRNAPETAPHPRLWIDAEFDTCFATSGGNDSVYEAGPLLGDDLTRETFLVAHLEVWGLGGADSLKARDAWRAQKDKMLLKQRQVDKSQFANNTFDREFLLKGTFSGGNRETNDN